MSTLTALNPASPATDAIPLALRAALAQTQPGHFAGVIDPTNIPANQLQRAFTVKREAVNLEARTVELAFASETPYERYWGVEILDTTATSMRLGRMTSGANLLCDHDSTDVVGVVESVSIGADRVARALVRFGKSERASEVFQDVADGIRRNVSVGYMIHRAVLVESTDGLDTYRVTDWEPFEVSMVSVPADASVGVGRSAASTTTLAAPATPLTPQTVTPTPKGRPMSDIQAPAAAAAAEQRNHALEISKLAATIATPGAGDLALKSIQAGHTVELFQAEVLRNLSLKPLPTAAIGMTAKEGQRYSVLRAIRALTDKDWTHAGFERECHNAILKRSGMGEAPNNGFFVPYEVQKRDMTAGTANAGGVLVATDNLASSFIDLLRNRAVVAQLGATMLSGLQGNVTIPKQTAGGTAYWLTNEATAITESQQTLGQLSMTPKNVGAYTEISRQLMQQSSPAADMLVMNDLSRVLALAIDLAALEGSGASGQPTGISNTASIGAVTGTTIAYSGILEFQTDVAAANALAANCAYVTTPAVAALLAARQRFTSTDTPLWQGNVLDGTVSGFRAMSTNQVTAASMIFGDFSQVVIGEWGMLELALNPYANFTAAISGVRAIQTVDVGIRYAGAFARATSIS
jgi:HK97 family phage major capsid protein